MFKRLANTISSLARAIDGLTEERKDEFEWVRSHIGLVTKRDLEEMEDRIMSAISDFSARVSAHNDKIDAAVAGLESDVQGLKTLIEELQNTPGTITPEDQALLDQIETRAAAVATKLEALDALTPPPTPA